MLEGIEYGPVWLADVLPADHTADRHRMLAVELGEIIGSTGDVNVIEEFLYCLRVRDSQTLVANLILQELQQLAKDFFR